MLYLAAGGMCVESYGRQDKIVQQTVSIPEVTFLTLHMTYILTA
jgi:hypothetical protein